MTSMKRIHLHLALSLVLLLSSLAIPAMAATADIPPGTRMVKDIKTDDYLGNSGSPHNLTEINGTVFFEAYDDGTGGEVWRSDGTEAGTVLIKDISSGATSSDPQNLINFNDILFFSATEAPPNEELWRSDGTAAGTYMLKDIQGSVFGSNPTSLTVVGDKLFFVASGWEDTELWVTDGTEAGTKLVRDIHPTGGSNPNSLTNVNGTLFFSADDDTNGYELWKSDGTEAGTVMVKNINPTWYANPSELTNVNGTLFFKANDGTNGCELWKSDGTEAGTVLVKDIKPGQDSSLPGRMVAIGTTLYFVADDGTNGRELWKSDGTANGTVMIKDINPDGDAITGGGLQMIDVNGTLFFQAEDGTHGRELWKSDGTTVGTVLIKDINPSGDSSSASWRDEWVAVGGTLFFQGDDGIYGPELWKSDGTAEGTVMVKDIHTCTGSYPGEMINVDGTVFFQATNGYHGFELWTSDGTDVSSLTITKDVNASTVQAGETVTYTVAFTNTAPAAATNVRITDTLATDFSSATYVSSGVALTEVVDSRYAWTAPDLQQGDTGVLKISATLTDSVRPQTIHNYATLAVSGTVHVACAAIEVLEAPFLSVELPSGETIDVEAEATDTIESVKAKVEQQTGIPAEKQVLTYQGQKLEDDRTLADYNILQGSTLILSYASAVSLTKVVTPTSAAPGDDITYTISFSNTGAATVSDVVITDTLSASIADAGYTSSGVILSPVTGQAYAWTAPDLATGDGGIITVTGTLVKPLGAGTLPNTVTIAFSGTVQSATADLTVVNVAPVADAGEDQAVGKGTLTSLDGSGADDNGDDLTYGWTQTGGLDVVLSSTTAPTPTFTAPDSDTVLTFTLTVTDTEALVDTDEVVITVSTLTDLAIEKSIQITGYSNVTYTLIAQNLGPNAADGAVISDTLTNMTHVTWSCTGSGTGIDDDVQVTLATFPVNDIVTCTINGRLTYWGHLKNTAEIILPAGIADSEMDNNRATVERWRMILPIIYKNYTR